MAVTSDMVLWQRLLRLKNIDRRLIVFAYDRPCDTLTVHFYGRGRISTSVPLGDEARDRLYVLVDRERDEIVGIQFEDFLDQVVFEHPGLIEVLESAELRGITRPEIEEVKLRLDADRVHAAVARHFMEELRFMVAD